MKTTGLAFGYPTSHPTSSPPRRGRDALFELSEQDLLLKKIMNRDCWMILTAPFTTGHLFLGVDGWLSEAFMSECMFVDREKRGRSHHFPVA